MLIEIEKGISEGDIVAFKLTNGDEIIAKFISESDSGYKVNRPCTVVPSQQGIGLIQSLFTADINNVTLQKIHVMFYAKVVDKIESHYIRTVTGIQTTP